MQCSICNREFGLTGSGDGSQVSICSECLTKGMSIPDASAIVPMVETVNSNEWPAPTPNRLIGHVKWRCSGGAAANVSWPISAAAHPHGGIVVLDEPENYRLLQFSNNGVFQRVIAEIAIGEGDDEIDDPQGVCVDANGMLYIPDAGNDRVSVWSPAGHHLRHFGQPGSSEGDFAYPTDVDVDADLFIFVAESFNRRIQKFSPEGIVSLMIDDRNVEQKWQNPTAVTTDSQHQIYVSDEDADLVRIFSASGKLLQRWPDEMAGAIQFDGPSDIRIDPADTIYISDRRNLRIRRITQAGVVTGTIDLSAGQTEVYNGGDIAVIGDSVVIPDRANNAIVCLEFETSMLEEGGL